MAAPNQTHVIELACPAYIRPRYVRRLTTDGGFVICLEPKKARRFDPTAAAQALRDVQPAIESGAWTPTVVPLAALGVAP